MQGRCSWIASQITVLWWIARHFQHHSCSREHQLWREEKREPSKRKILCAVDSLFIQWSLILPTYSPVSNWPMAHSAVGSGAMCAQLCIKQWLRFNSIMVLQDWSEISRFLWFPLKLCNLRASSCKAFLLQTVLMTKVSGTVLHRKQAVFRSKGHRALPCKCNEVGYAVIP